MPGHGSTECAVKAVSPPLRVERSESLDGAEASLKMELVMVGLMSCVDEADRFDRLALPTRRGGAVRRG